MAEREQQRGPQKNQPRNYDDEKSKIKSFLAEFYQRNQRGGKEFVYARQLTKIAHREQASLTLELDHVQEHDPDLAEAIRNNARRYTLLTSEAVSEMLPDYRERDAPAKDALDVYIHHRQLMDARTRGPNENRPPQNAFPPELMRRFEVHFKTSSDTKSVPIREVKAECIGKLINIKGIITRATEVKPMMQVATYTCDQCGAETYQTVNATAFMPLLMCPGEDCRVNKSGGRLHLQTRGSKFIKFQELKVQEHSDTVPVGHIPRLVTVYARGETTRAATPGDHVSICGVYLPIQRVGFAAIAQVCEVSKCF